jgi:hypothetical protein
VPRPGKAEAYLVQLADIAMPLLVHRHGEQRARSAAHSYGGFSINVTLRGFIGPFTTAFFLGDMSKTVTVEQARERRMGDGVAGKSRLGGLKK